VSEYPASYKYSKDHEWVSLEGDVATVGITDYAQGELGDIIYLELPEVGQSLAEGESFGTVEAVKTVEELFAPVDGEILEVNAGLADKPELVNQSPFDEGWLLKFRVENSARIEALMDREAYLDMVGE
jgi:glycine cleavage system H protein